MVQDRDSRSKERTHPRQTRGELPLGGVQTKAKPKPWLSEEERFVELLTRNGRMTSLQLAAQLGMSRRQVMQIAQNIRTMGLAPLSTSLKGGYWIGTDGLEHLRRRALILIHEYKTMKAWRVKEAMQKQGKLGV
jgi:DNA-binding CsgD family transcriptional regulator